MRGSVLLLSSSNVHGYGFLEYNRDAIADFMNGINTPLLFVPYAADRNEWDYYTDKVRAFFKKLNIGVTGAHTVSKDDFTNTFDAVFVGGGNTFRLLNELQEQKMMAPLRYAVATGRMRYMGSSAGSNLATRSICTTNDMPIVYPRGGFDGLNLFTHQLNPHYLDPDMTTKHKGETRDQRIAEFHQVNDTPVVGLREGAYIRFGTDFPETHELYIGGTPGAKIFEKNKEPYEAPIGQTFRLP